MTIKIMGIINDLNSLMNLLIFKNNLEFKNLINEL